MEADDLGSGVITRASRSLDTIGGSDVSSGAPPTRRRRPNYPNRGSPELDRAERHAARVPADVSTARTPAPPVAPSRRSYPAAYRRDSKHMPPRSPMLFSTIGVIFFLSSWGCERDGCPWSFVARTARERNSWAIRLSVGRGNMSDFYRGHDERSIDQVGRSFGFCCDRGEPYRVSHTIFFVAATHSGMHDMTVPR
jgi:hypothetical protein